MEKFKFQRLFCFLRAFILITYLSPVNLEAQSAAVSTTASPPLTASSPSRAGPPAFKKRKGYDARTDCFKHGGEIYQSNERSLGENIKVVIFGEEILYRFRYEDDGVNFLLPITQGEGILKEWLILVNFHGDAEFNHYKEFSCKRDQGKRSLAWGTPFVWAATSLRRLGDVLNYLALPMPWSEDKVRKNISFVLVPPGSAVKFMIGFAGAQQSPRKGYSYTERRSGYGMQIRWEALPKGTIVFTVPFNQFASHERGSKRAVIGKEAKKISLITIFEEVLGRYVPEGPDDPLTPEEIERILTFNANVMSGENGDFSDPEILVKDIYNLEVNEKIEGG